MAGIYIHIPFCAQRCSYCDFHFSTNLSLLNQMQNALKQELVLRSGHFKHAIETIYFGGGTPSLFSESYIQTIIQTIRDNYDVLNELEITLEANPEDLTQAYLTGLEKAGVNRLSIGVQSFFDSDLQFMNRNHSAKQAIYALDLAKEMGFCNINMDLIYGSPTTTNEQWQRSIDVFLERGIPHLSAYALTVEPKTALAKQIEKSTTLAPKEKRAEEQFSILTKSLKHAGFLHYEISNFALPNKMAVHNTNYWKNKPYLGIGPSAHSFTGVKRSWNIRNNKKYIDAIAQKSIPSEEEELTQEDRFNERIMTGLRTIWGVNLEELAQDFPLEWLEGLERDAKSSIESGQIQKQANTWILSDDARFLADGIAAQLFRV